MSDTSRIVRVFVEVDGFATVREAEDHVARVLMADGCVLGVASGTPENASHYHWTPCRCGDVLGLAHPSNREAGDPGPPRTEVVA